MIYPAGTGLIITMDGWMDANVQPHDGREMVTSTGRVVV